MAAESEMPRSPEPLLPHSLIKEGLTNEVCRDEAQEKKNVLGLDFRADEKSDKANVVIITVANRRIAARHTRLRC